MYFGEQCETLQMATSHKGITRSSMALWILAACVIYALMQGTLMQLAVFKTPGFMWGVAVIAGTTALLWCAIAAASAELSHRLSESRLKSGLSTILVLITGAIASAILGAAWSYSALNVLGLRGGRHAGFIQVFVTQLDLNVFVYTTVIIGVTAAHRRRKTLAVEQQSAVAEREIATTRLQVLSMQLQPHFLFNTLHSIAELVHSNASAASEMVSRLRNLMKHSLDRAFVDSVSLEEELATLESYVAIQKMRFGDRITMHIDAGDDVMSARIPPLLLQPLVENAIRHGVRGDSSVVRIVISAARSAAALRIEIRNNGAPLADNYDEGHGLSNTRRRLEQFFGAGTSTLTLKSSGAGDTVASITAPLGLSALPLASHAIEPFAPSAAFDHRRRPLLVVAGVVAGWTLWACIWIMQAKLLTGIARPPIEPPFYWLLKSALINAWSWAALTFIVAAIVRRWPAGSIRYIWIYALAVLSIIAIMMPFRWLMGLGLPGSPLLSPDRVNWAAWDLLAFTMIVVAATFMDRVRLEQRSRLRALHLGAELAVAKADVLRWQLQPDFLIDTLDEIERLAMIDPDGADALTMQLGDSLRLVLQRVEVENIGDRSATLMEAVR